MSTVKSEIKEFRFTSSPINASRLTPIPSTPRQKVNVEVSRSILAVCRARIGIASKHFDKPPTRDGVPNVLYHQFVGRNALRRIDKSSEIGRGPFHCGNTLTLTNDEVKRISSIDVDNRRVI